MADDGGILGLLGRMNDPNALYGGALTDPATRQAMAGRGLLSMAGSFADSAMPTRMPTPFGAVLGHAASAAGASEDTIMESRLRNAQAQQAMANVGVLNQIGPAYKLWMDEQLRLAAGGAPGGGIPQAPPPGTAPGTVGPGGPAPTGPLNPDLVTWHAKNVGLDPLIAHTGADIESSYGANTRNEKSPSNTGVFQRAKADAPGGMNDTIDNQIKLGVGDLVSARNGLRNNLGREPTNAEVYLAHQQGVPGATKLIGNPNTPAGELVPPVNISNNGGERFVKAPASAFVEHWAQEYNKREAKFARPAAPVVAGGGIAAGPSAPPSGGQTALAPPLGGLLTMPENIAGRMNEPIPGIGAGPAPPAPGAPGTPAAAAAAAPPRSAGEALMAMNQATQAAGGLPPLPPGLPQMADASGQVPPGPTLVPGGKAIPGLLSGGAAPPGPPPQIAAGPPPGQPTPLIPAPPPDAPVPPAARPPVAVPQAPPPVATPTGPPGAPPPLNLPAPPPMPAGMGAPPATPLQIISQGIAGLSSLTGHPAPEFMQKLANQPVEMQMEAYKAYVGAQANMLSEKYKKEIEVASAQALEYFKTQGALPADLTKITLQQKLDLDTKMRVLGFLPDEKGNYTKIDPLYLEKKAREAAIEAEAKADNALTTVTVTDANGQHEQQMTVKQARDYLRTQGGGPGAGASAAPGTPGAGIPSLGIPGTPGAAAPGTPPGIPGKPVYGPGQEAELKARGEVYGGEYKQVAANATAAEGSKPYLLAIRRAIEVHDTTGTGDAARLDAWKAVQGAATTFGFSIPEGLQDWIAKGEIISKGGTYLGFNLSRTLGGGSHTSEVIIQQAVKNNPGLGNSPKGNQDLLNLLETIGDRSVAERKFYDDWWDSHKTYAGAGPAFNKQNPWEVTMSQFAPYHTDKLGRDDASAKAAYDKLPTGVKVQSDKFWWIKPPPGQAIVSHPLGGQ